MADDFSIKSRGNLRKATEDVSKLFERLSSGKRINKASDDAAGLAVAASLGVTVELSGVGKRNIGDANSALQIADGALDQISQIGSRLSELAAQSANGTLSDEQRSSLNAEFQQLTQEAQRISQTTTFNGTNVLGSPGIQVQVGQDSSANSQISVSGDDVGSITGALSGLDVSSISNARAALDGISSFVSNIAQARGTRGAVSNRLDTARNNLDSLEESASAARSRIEDVDVAESVANLTAARIRQNSSAALSAQGAGLTRDTVLRLLS